MMRWYRDPNVVWNDQQTKQGTLQASECCMSGSFEQLIFHVSPNFYSFQQKSTFSVTNIEYKHASLTALSL